ncbi:hypothetical protein CBM2587_A50039 [Cupriavidus taiwanensis]|uniref:Uncharacterized protein n=1 Tax=Cupriavidus taiwanensis TaxID=164546 RepID=A0A975X328_9BURK|nr:hypothetical protein CBM2587_A50039 [Cupriavidus taiwanensis]
MQPGLLRHAGQSGVSQAASGRAGMPVRPDKNGVDNRNWGARRAHRHDAPAQALEPTERAAGHAGRQFR